MKKLPRHGLGKLTRASFNCTNSDCYPPAGDLILGRKKLLYANSTCGSSYPEKYCILGETFEKHSKAYPIEAFFHHLNIDRINPTRCFLCDSRWTQGIKNQQY